MRGMLKVDASSSSRPSTQGDILSNSETAQTIKKDLSVNNNLKLEKQFGRGFSFSSSFAFAVTLSFAFDPL